jgi:hypothetical protein
MTAEVIQLIDSIVGFFSDPGLGERKPFQSVVIDNRRQPAAFYFIRQKRVATGESLRFRDGRSDGYSSRKFIRISGCQNSQTRCH